MKKFFVILFLAGSFFTVRGQISGGIKGGANFSKLESEYLVTDSETGFYGGVFATYAFSELLAVQPEVYYSHQAGAPMGIEYSFDYLAVPLLLRVKFDSFHLYGGAHFGFLMNVDAEDVDKDDFKGIALSGAIGAGYELPPGIEFGGRYVHGLSDISNNPYISDVHFRMWELYAAWRIFGK